MSFNNSGYPGNQPNSDQWGAPASQSSAGHPGSQSSAGYPGSQSSAGYPSSQSSAGYVDQAGYNQQAYQPQQGYAEQQAHYPGQPVTTAQQQWAPQTPRTDQDSFVKAILDFGFTRYATPSVVKILYILGIVVGVIGWFLSGLSWIMIGGAMAAFNPYSAGGESTLFAVLAWVFGLIPLFFWVIALRVSLEFALAIVRISQDSKAIREKQA